MGGGLINIVSYVSNDLYLTGSPQITFYKMMYRRYTNFSMESISLDFDDDIKFNCESELIPPRVGDLMHKSYLHINIPSVNISKNDVGIDTNDIAFDYANKYIINNYNNIKNVYMEILMGIYRIVFKAVNALNVPYTGLIQDVHEYVNSENRLVLLDAYDKLLLETKQGLKYEDPNINIFDNNRSNLWYIITHTDVNRLFDNAKKSINEDEFEENTEAYTNEINRIMKLTILKELERGIDVCTNIQNYYFNEYNKFIERVNADKNPNIRFAWVKNLGHSIIEYIDVYIGGKRIDRHLGIWINIWYQLTYKEAQIQIYDKMIGNVDQLTNFDNTEKPEYNIYVPLTFWFNKFNGLSFPLISMQYNDIRFCVKLRKLEEVFFIEKIYRADVNGIEKILTASLIDFLQNKAANRNEITNIEEVEDITLQDIWEDKGHSLHGHILMDYIYLESPERKRFAQSGHEYLIERIQYDRFDNINQLDLNIRLDFTNPSKELIWVMNKDIYTTNESGWNACRWGDHTTGIDKKNPIDTCNIQFNNYTRVQKQVGLYFDVYQPVTYHNVSPERGINMYSFCIDPRQHQPNGSCNFSRLTNVMLFLQINRLLYTYTDPDIYPYDLDINFILTITDPIEFMDTIDQNATKKEIALLTDTIDNIRKIKIQNIRRCRLEKLNKLETLYTEFLNGDNNKIEMDLYRLIVFKTNATLTVFSLTMNILRLIGGYGTLAYSGNN